MDNLFFNASLSNRPPAAAFERAEHPFKGIDHADRAPFDTMAPAAAVNASGTRKILQDLPTQPALHHAAPNHARSLLGLSTLPKSPDGAPKMLHERSLSTEAPSPKADAAAATGAPD